MKATYKRVGTSIIMLCFVMSLFAGISGTALAAEVRANASSTSNQYSSDWVYWSAGASKYADLRGWGCRMVAYSKLLRESGVESAVHFNPDAYYEWALNNGYVNSKMQELGGGKGPSAYAASVGKSLKYQGRFMLSNAKNSDNYRQIMDYINQGYYVVAGCTAHYAYIGREKSIAAGTPVILNSWINWSQTKNLIVNYKDYTELNFAYVLLYSLSDISGSSNITVTTKTVTTGAAEAITDTNAIVNGLLEASNPVSITECGMYLGTSPDSMSRVAYDAVSSAPRNVLNFWYDLNSCGTTLKPGMTYYYQAYGVMNGTTSTGQIASFTTAGAKELGGPAKLRISMTQSRIPPAGSTTVSWQADRNSLRYIILVTNLADGRTEQRETTATEYTLKDMFLGKYQISVYGENDTSCGLPSEALQLEILNGISLPQKPVIRLSAREASVGDSITVSWDADANTAEYRVHYDVSYPIEDSLFNGVMHRFSATQDNSYTLTLDKAGDYTVSVVARNQYNDQVASDELTLLVKNPAPEVTPIPVPPPPQEVTPIPVPPPPPTSYTGYVCGTISGELAMNRTASVAYEIALLPERASCTVYPDKSDGNWLWVEYNGLSGYCYNRYISKTGYTPEGTFTAYVRCSSSDVIAINRTPSAAYEIGLIPTGAACTVYPAKSTGNWHWIEYNGISGYSYCKFISAQ